MKEFLYIAKVRISTKNPTSVIRHNLNVREWMDLYWNLNVKFNDSKIRCTKKEANDLSESNMCITNIITRLRNTAQGKQIPPPRPMYLSKTRYITSTSSLRFRTNSSNLRASVCRSNLLCQRVFCLCFLFWKIWNVIIQKVGLKYPKKANRYDLQTETIIHLYQLRSKKVQHTVKWYIWTVESTRDVGYKTCLVGLKRKTGNIVWRKFR